MAPRRTNVRCPLAKPEDLCTLPPGVRCCMCYGDVHRDQHARIFLAAVEAEVPVQPVALRYGDGGSRQTVVAFGPTESFAANLLRLLGEPGCSAEVVFLEPILPGDTEGRRRLADTARTRIVDAMTS